MVELEDWYHRYNGWSFSKHRLWNLCKRAYYYRYIGTALKKSKDLDISRLKKLKELNTRFALQGLLIHEVLENQIGQHSRGREMSENGAKIEYTQKVEEYRKRANDTLIEYFNGEPIDGALFDRIRVNGLDQISRFFGVIWPQLMDLEYLRHEKFDRFKIGDVAAIVKVDYVCKTKEGKIVLCDWKTGIDSVEYESDLQIGAYVLWAMENYKKEPEDIRSELIYLTSGAMRAYEFSMDELNKIKRMIVADFGEMNKIYDINYFQPDPEPKKCLSCQFATVCHHSMAIERLNNVRQKNPTGNKTENKEEEDQSRITDVEDELKLTIFVDPRETRTGIARFLEKAGVALKLQNLEIGDYVVSNKVCIERKTGTDFLDSVIHKRRNLFEQIQRMKDEYEKPLLVIEGDSIYGQRNVHPNVVRAVMASIALDYSVPIIQTRDVADTASLIYIIAKREQVPIKTEVNPQGKKPSASLKEQQEYFVSALSNIGIVTTRKLLERFETLERIMAASKEELMEVENVGEKTAEYIRKVLSTEYNEEESKKGKKGKKGHLWITLKNKNLQIENNILKFDPGDISVEANGQVRQLFASAVLI